MIFSTGFMIVEMISNNVIPNKEAIYPMIETQRIVMIVGNNTANDYNIVWRGSTKSKAGK